jgi:bifunctional damage-control phosphatase, subfamily II, fusion protein|tara:strand:+ start:1505 stop:3898 length:2394 start_codon:yes stop_codon:yes gene_type:complete|eukprot:30453-Pelagococcus_subviridis.AAC.13
MMHYTSRNSLLFQRRFGIQLQKEDEMECAVAGANFLLETIRDEAFTFTHGQKDYVVPEDLHEDNDDLFPYLLVNIGSGVSIIKVDRSSFERIGGTNIGGGTFWGLCRLLTGLQDFDEMLACSAAGDNSKVDMLVGDIYGGRDYLKVGLSSSTIASSFGRVVTEEGSLEDYNKADITLSLLRMISYNISHIATLMAVKHGLKRIFFGGYFIRGHAYTMNTISFAVDYWSKGELKAMFLRHEGFLGALGAFLQDAQAQSFYSVPLRGPWIENIMKYSVPSFSWKQRMDFKADHIVEPQVGKVCTDNSCLYGIASGTSACSVKRVRFVAFLQCSISKDEQTYNRNGTLSQSVYFGTCCTNVDKKSLKIIPSLSTHKKNLSDQQARRRKDTESAYINTFQDRFLEMDRLQMDVLNLKQTLITFPLLCCPVEYEPDIIDLHESREEREYWLDILHGVSQGLLEKALTSENTRHDVCEACSDDAGERVAAFSTVFCGHLDRLREEPSAYGRIGLSGLFELREECLRAYGFRDAYFQVKKQENAAALAVLPDLFSELDGMLDEERLLVLIEGVLAGNIFDWGSQSCVDLYNKGTVLEIYRRARASVARPWAVDCFDKFRAVFFGNGIRVCQYNKALLFCDNSGADIVLGMLPFARELLKRGTDVCLVANSLPAINDVTAQELREVVHLAAENCKTLTLALSAHLRSSDNASLVKPSGILTVCANGSGSPCLDFRRVSLELCKAAEGADLIVLEGMGRAIHTNFNAIFHCDTLKLAMIKNSRLAEKLFGGKVYDCVCKFEPLCRT